MDIIDVLLAKATTPSGQASMAAAKASKSAQDAATAKEDAQAAIDAIDSITEQTNANNEKAAETLASVEEALAKVEETLNNLEAPQLDVAAVDSEISKLALGLDWTSSNNANVENIILHYPDGGDGVLQNVLKLYKSTGANEDGTMTQKAITDFINSTKEELTTTINNIQINTGSGSGMHFDKDDAGNIVVIGEDGNPIASDITEEALIEALLRSGSYTAQNGLGLTVNYQNRTNVRTQEAATLTGGSPFNEYAMFGGRMRCNVADDGTITAFYGEANYRDDGSNGQVMVYQPKFYYQRIPLTINNSIIQEDSIIISRTEQKGFKLHPLFRDEENNPLEYALIPAYEGGLFDASSSTYLTADNVTFDFTADKLSSVAGAKPITGAKNSLTIGAAERLAQNRGTSWHITNLAVESANQMLEMVEYGMMNSQTAIGAGIVNGTSVAKANSTALTGSTASLGNESGSASVTTHEVNGSVTTATGEGQVAVSYRGMENPWGNRWHFVGGLNILGNGGNEGGVPYICNDYNYNVSTIGNNYGSVGFSVPNTVGWVSNMGYSNKAYDWAFLPIVCDSDSANSALPVGDKLWTITNLNGMAAAIAGGMISSKESAGAFYYAFDHRESETAQASYGANLMFVPTINNIYYANIAKWNAITGGRWE